MTKRSKILYLLLSIVFFILFNGYLSELIIVSGNEFIDNPIFNIVYIQNQGAAFNIFEGHKLFLITFSLSAIIAMFIYFVKHIDKHSTFGLFFAALLISGIFNNMAERIYFGFVRDFIKLNFIDFPVFNISDIFINIGVLGIIIIIIKNSYFKNIN